MGQVSEGLVRFEEALGYYERAMEAFEKRRHRLSIDNHKMAISGDSVVQEIYFGAAHGAAQWHLSTPESAADRLSPQIQRAFMGLERGKARSLLDLIEGATPDPTRDEGLESQWQEFRRQGTQLITLQGLLSKCHETEHLNRNSKIRPKANIQRKESKFREL
jgi:hypothetical protein